ncbi:lasso peptide biosynthesis B2 protein [Brevundimonas aurantiaca]|jgi:hypothetical protein|uniref:Microcin J25-processing protein McjB C-terminal domain-containing protein n=1 Tax=Brevundimonas aurantiaca TaxID=74316 RepID=A0A7W9C8A0_9CAUL|nr:lasso peptide biosynthesis B2 protein [Brevundimonas aurantiaca]MBB5740794.1 hypothetical protein [Brevundimonas aurantiaca]
MAVVDDDVIVLDVKGDAYHCLVAGAQTLRITPQGGLSISDPLLAADLQDAGLIRGAPFDMERPAPILPQRELLPSRSPPRSEILRIGLSWIVAAIIFRRKRLHTLVDFHRGATRVTAKRSEKALAEIVGAARMVRPWIPGEGECLQRSFQLRCVLASQGIATDWVFGVRTWPFGAHCWLQIGDLVVGDRLARVRRYVPIMRA